MGKFDTNGYGLDIFICRHKTPVHKCGVCCGAMSSSKITFTNANGEDASYTKIEPISNRFQLCFHKVAVFRKKVERAEAAKNLLHEIAKQNGISYATETWDDFETLCKTLSETFKKEQLFPVLQAKIQEAQFLKE